jgi:acid stress-induced BolA-like protein IbaG/YrbA
MDVATVKALIEKGLTGATAEVQSNDDRHFSAIVISDDFVGQSMVMQQQRVYQLLGDFIASGELHALSLKTYTLAQWQVLNNK